MKVPLSWLKKYINVSKEPEALAEVLTLAGLEVDKIDLCSFSFTGVVVGKVTEVTPHPDADKLKCLTVTDGKKSYPIVCGDTSIKEGDVVPLAKIGATFKTSKDSFTIKKAKLRGIESQGMLASAKELGLSNNDEKVHRLKPEAPLGEDLATYLYDPVLDIALTPNLAYCRCMIGIGRELKAQLDEELSLPSIHMEEGASLASEKIRVTNNSPDTCLQYNCRVIKGVTVEDSPSWLVDWLEKAGYQSVNNVVDVTNFVMHELGQPLHAFDYKQLPNQHLHIRKANPEEKIKLLDGNEYTLTEEYTIICDDETPLAVAGVMGGEDSGISTTTSTVVLEGALFSTVAVRKMSKKLGIRTESSARFENGVDPAGIQFALNRAATLIKEIAGGEILKGFVEDSPEQYKPQFISCRLSRINTLLGTKFSLNEVETFLKKLGITLSSDGNDLYQIRIPSWRGDISEEIDIVEEVARVYGYNNIERKKPYHVNSERGHDTQFLWEKQIRSKLVSLNLQEFITCNLISPELCNLELENGLFHNEYIEVLHAKSIDQSILRPSLLPGLLATIKTNQNHGTYDIAAFEIGKVHFRKESDIHEKTSLGIILTGKKTPIHWDQKEKTVDFYDLKGTLASLFQTLLLPKFSFTESSLKTFHPGRQSTLDYNGNRFGVFGAVHPTSLETLGIKGEVYFAEIDLTALYPLKPTRKLFEPLPQFPSSERDWTFSMPLENDLSKIFKALETLSSPLLKTTILLDVYTGEKAEVGRKNISLRFTYRDDSKTIDLGSVEKEHARIIHSLSKLV